MDDDESKIKAAYDEYADQIYRFLYWQTGDALLAEDITSEVFYRAWKNKETFLGYNQRAWLYRVARNLIIDYYRKKKETHFDEKFEPLSDIDLHGNAERNETIQKVRRVVADLPPQFRSVVILRFFEQLSCREVADIMNKSESNIRVLQHRALKELKGKLEHI